jgi:antitoxin CptB
MSELSRLRWLCRRGMKELDVVLSRYLELNYELASPGDQQIFRSLLDMQDPDLYALIIGRSSAPDESTKQFIEQLRSLKKQR